MSPLIRLQNFGVHYRGAASPSLTGVDLDIAAGERLAVIGESGSGKTTLALALAGLLPADAVQTGSLYWPGFSEHPRPGRDIGFVFQDPGSSLDPVLTIGEQIAEVAHAHVTSNWNAAYALAAELLGRVRIPDPVEALRAFPHQLSGGQRQRVAIAAAIAAQPKVLIADEATSALDMIVQAEITALLDDLVRERGMTLIFVTHDIALASQLAERVAVFHAARLVEAGLARDVLAQPQAAYTKQLIAAHIDLSAPPMIGALP